MPPPKLTAKSYIIY